MDDELFIRVHLSEFTDTYHYDIYRNEPKKSGAYYLDSIASGCVLCTSLWGEQRCIRAARRHARRILRKERRRGGRTDHIEVVTLDGKPSRAQLERKIAELEAELDVN